MRVLQINTTVNSGSTGRIAEDIGQVLLSDNHESHIAYGRGNRPSKSKLYRIGTQKDVLLHGLKTIVLDRHGFASSAATKKLISEIDTIAPDLVALYNLHGYYVNIEILFHYLRKKNIPVIWTLFDCWAFTGHCTYFDDISCEKWKTHCQNCPKTSRYPKSLLMDNSFRNFEDKRKLFTSLPKLHLLVHSAWLKRLTQESFLKALPVHHIPTGIDTSVFHPCQELSINLPLDKKIVLGVASIWDPRKGLEDFLTLAKQLPQEYQLVLVGLSKKQQADLPNNIVGIARTENVRQLAELYSCASVFVNPTYQDNFPTTNLEALACGTPVVTYNTGGSPEAVNPDTGVIVPKGNIEQLNMAIQTVCSREEDILSNSCRKRAVQLYDKNEQYKKYLKLYEHIIANS